MATPGADCVGHPGRTTICALPGSPKWHPRPTSRGTSRSLDAARVVQSFRQFPAGTLHTALTEDAICAGDAAGAIRRWQTACSGGTMLSGAANRTGANNRTGVGPTSGAPADLNARLEADRPISFMETHRSIALPGAIDGLPQLRTTARIFPYAALRITIFLPSARLSACFRARRVPGPGAPESSAFLRGTIAAGSLDSRRTRPGAGTVTTAPVTSPDGHSGSAAAVLQVRSAHAGRAAI